MLITRNHVKETRSPSRLSGSDAQTYYVKSRIAEWIITIHFPLSVDIFSCVIMKGDLPQTEMGCWLDLWEDFPDRNSFLHL